MSSISTIKLSKRFIEAGTSKKEAEVLTEVFREMEMNSTANIANSMANVASKKDLKLVKEDLKAFKAETKENFALLRSEMKDYFKLYTVFISLGLTALGFLMTYLHAH